VGFRDPAAEPIPQPYSRADPPLQSKTGIAGDPVAGLRSVGPPGQVLFDYFGMASTDRKLSAVIKAETLSGSFGLRSSRKLLSRFAKDDSSLKFIVVDAKLKRLFFVG
jgi:hypothetical protein